MLRSLVGSEMCIRDRSKSFRSREQLVMEVGELRRTLAEAQDRLQAAQVEAGAWREEKKHLNHERHGLSSENAQLAADLEEALGLLADALGEREEALSEVAGNLNRLSTAEQETAEIRKRQASAAEEAVVMHQQLMDDRNAAQAKAAQYAAELTQVRTELVSRLTAEQCARAEAEKLLELVRVDREGMSVRLHESETARLNLVSAERANAEQLLKLQAAFDVEVATAVHLDQRLSDRERVDLQTQATVVELEEELMQVRNQEVAARHQLRSLQLNQGDEISELEAKLQESEQPVSYTHLRAHETPEHLVCRLLLEKKKNIQQDK
eukprot:TRINITY_DN26305_c0_g1_i1.p1 TRINITY_DN26305_c0_g1~~TRINITY_DN26305_c0_g1_i1.p1  ORF type:complete len:341 (+),score=132.03 TRINITY_DN26305_c0_g1_i1:53-1024(+)